MAQRIVTQLVDDIDGSEIVDGAGETVVFSLDGHAYEIDLSTKRAEELRSALAEYVESGRRVTGRATDRSAKRGTAAGGPAASEIREWARSNGFDVPDRGRTPQEVRKAFDER